MFKVSLSSALLFVAISPVIVLADATTSTASARSACVKNRVVEIIEDGRLTSRPTGGINNCWVYDGDLGRAIKPSSSKKNCWIESYGKCSGPSDEGWIKMRKIRAAN